jgi:hypothetical protein
VRHARRFDVPEADEVVDEREAARQRVHARREFGSDLAAYVVVNVVVIGIWAVSGAGYFWPAWVLLVWGAFLALHAWKAFWRRPMTEGDIDAELHRHNPVGR